MCLFCNIHWDQRATQTFLGGPGCCQLRNMRTVGPSSKYGVLVLRITSMRGRWMPENSARRLKLVGASKPNESLKRRCTTLVPNVRAILSLPLPISRSTRTRSSILELAGAAQTNTFGFGKRETSIDALSNHGPLRRGLFYCGIFSPIVTIYLNEG
jgi:hypothetical protein